MGAKKVNLQRALEKKAAGYIAREITDEFVPEDGKLRLVKRRVIKKPVPPDLAAIRELRGERREKGEFDGLSDGELEAECARLERMLGGDGNETGNE